jgi:Family of unknown function (DUF1028)
MESGGGEAGGGSRGKQSAALLVVRAKGGFNGFTDCAIDVRVDDSREPPPELARLADLAMVNDSWNQGWTAFTEKRYPDALRLQQETVRLAERQNIFPEVLRPRGDPGRERQGRRGVGHTHSARPSP